jgi:hypothetical protein
VAGGDLIVWQVMGRIMEDGEYNVKFQFRYHDSKNSDIMRRAFDIRL